jgi:hypothetical protein
MLNRAGVGVGGTLPTRRRHQLGLGKVAPSAAAPAVHPAPRGFTSPAQHPRSFAGSRRAEETRRRDTRVCLCSHDPALALPAIPVISQSFLSRLAGTTLAIAEACSSQCCRPSPSPSSSPSSAARSKAAAPDAADGSLRALFTGSREGGKLKPGFVVVRPVDASKLPCEGLAAAEGAPRGAQKTSNPRCRRLATPWGVALPICSQLGSPFPTSRLPVKNGLGT